MKRLVTWMIACALMMGATVAMAAEEAVPKDLIENWEAAAQEIKDMKIQQEMTIPDGPPEPVQMTVLRKGPKYRSEMTMQGMTIITIFDGTDTWMVTPMGVQKSPMRQQTPNVAPGTAFPEGARLTGSESVDGRDCHIIEFTDPATGEITKLWIDKNVPTIVKYEGKQDGQTTVASYSDFRKVKGDYEMPYKCEMTSNGQPAGSVTMKSIEVNTGLNDDIFDPNSEAAKKPTTTP